jgi:hypothetical protein
MFTVQESQIPVVVLPEPPLMGWSERPMQGVLVSLHTHLSRPDSYAAKCGLLNVTMTADPAKVSCQTCQRDTTWAKKKNRRIHYKAGLRVHCGRINVTATTRWADVTCELCKHARPNRKAERRLEPGYGEHDFKGLGILCCRNCGKPYAKHVGYQECAG